MAKFVDLFDASIGSREWKKGEVYEIPIYKVEKRIHPIMPNLFQRYGEWRKEKDKKEAKAYAEKKQQEREKKLEAKKKEWEKEREAKQKREND